MKSIYFFCIILLVLMGLIGCTSMRQTYYLTAYDPDTEHINYFRIKLKGNSSFSKTKFSVGFYDRNAIEQLFSETSLEQEYLSSKIDILDHETGNRLNDISELLSNAKTNNLNIKIERLIQVNTTIAKLIGEFRIRIKNGQNLNTVYIDSIEKAESIRVIAETELNSAITEKNENEKTAYANKASAGFQNAYLTMETIRIALDSHVLIRFFDGAGNPIDVSSKTMVIFVATDISRFAEAIRQLAEAEKTTIDIMKIVFGEKIKQGRILKDDLARQKQYEASLQKRLTNMIDTLGDKPEFNDITSSILEAANAAAGSEVPIFSNSDQIIVFVKGMEE